MTDLNYSRIWNKAKNLAKLEAELILPPYNAEKRHTFQVDRAHELYRQMVDNPNSKKVSKLQKTSKR